MGDSLRSMGNGDEKDPNSVSRRDFLTALTGATAAFLVQPAQAAEKGEDEPRIALSALPKGPEDIYIVLFENNQRDARNDDDFIAGAAEAVGYEVPFQWHVEIMYFSAQKREWMFMGCRPPQCSMDKPALPFLARHKTQKIRVNRLSVPVNQQKQARQFFQDQFQGQAFNLTGPSATNCADVPAALAASLGMGNVKRMTRDQLLKIPKLREFLQKTKRTDVDGILHRPDIIFPDEFENFGQRLGILTF